MAVSESLKLEPDPIDESNVELWWVENNIHWIDDKIFYPDNVTGKNMTSYYCRDLKSDPTNAVLINDNVDLISGVQVSADGKRLLYVADHDLYLDELTVKNRLERDVYFFHVNEDFSKVLYGTGSDDVYLYDLDKKEVAATIAAIGNDYAFAQNLEDLYYIKDQVLYKKHPPQEEVEISAGVFSVHALENGHCYFQKAKNIQVHRAEYVQDDMLPTDSLMTEPDIEDFSADRNGFWWWYDTTTDWEAYWAAQEQFQAKRQRDEIREYLTGMHTLEIGDLYYYDGQSEILVTDDISSSELAEGEVMLYSKYIPGSIEPINLSEIESFSDIDEHIRKSRWDADNMFAAVKGVELGELPQTDAQYYTLAPDGSIYYLDQYTFPYDSDESDYGVGPGYGDLVKIGISGSQLLTPVNINDHVWNYSFGALPDEVIYYRKAREDWTAELYIDEQLVNRYCEIDSAAYYPQSDGVAFKERIGDASTLFLRKKGETLKIGEAVLDYAFIDADTIIYTTGTDYGGPLLMYTGAEEPVTVDEEIHDFLDIHKTAPIVHGDTRYRIY